MKKRIESLGAALYKAGNEEIKEVMLSQDNAASMGRQDFYMLWSLLFRTYCLLHTYDGNKNLYIHKNIYAAT